MRPSTAPQRKTLAISTTDLLGATRYDWVKDWDNRRLSDLRTGQATKKPTITRSNLAGLVWVGLHHVIGRVGGVVTQRIANPCTPVRFRYSPPHKINGLHGVLASNSDAERELSTILSTFSFGSRSLFLCQKCAGFLPRSPAVMRNHRR